MGITVLLPMLRRPRDREWNRRSVQRSSLLKTVRPLSLLLPETEERRASLFLRESALAQWSELCEGAVEQFHDVEHLLAGVVKLCTGAQLQQAARIRGDDDRY